MASENQADVIYDVIIIGAGPVGLCSALLLDKYNLSVAVIDMKTSPPLLPKALHTSQGSMEIFAKLGIYEKINQIGLPKSTPLTMKLSSGITSPPIVSFKMDGAEDIAQDFDSAIYVVQNGKCSKAECVFIPQPVLEQFLTEQIQKETKIDLFFGTEVIKLHEEGDGVVVLGKPLAHESSPCTYRSKYLIACDGSKSRVRKELGIHLHGEIGLQNFFSIHIESEDLCNIYENNPNSSRYGFNIAFQDGSLAMIFHMLPANKCIIHLSGGADKDISKFMSMDKNELVRNLIGRNTRFEIISSGDWHANQLIATHFQKGRIFLAGDSAHSWVPAGGFGMNTGIQDSANLCWKVAAMCQGWAGPYLAPSYQLEQKTYDYNVMRLVSQNLEILTSSNFPLWVRLSLPIIRIYSRLFPKKFRDSVGSGLKYFGYEILGQRLVASNLCMFEEEPAERLRPLPHPGSVVIQDLPGCRAPPISLSDELQIRNASYGSFLLLSFVENCDFSGFIKQASSRSIPVEYIYVKKDVNSVYQKRFYLIRPDTFIAWRSDRVPQGREIANVLDRAVGWVKPDRFNPVYATWDWKNYPNTKKELCIITPLIAGSIWAFSLPSLTFPILLLLYCGTYFYRVMHPKLTPRREIMSRHKAILCNAPGNPRDVISLITNRSCEIEPDDIVVNVKYAALHTIDYKLCRGYAANLLNLVFSLSHQKRYPLLLGRDFSGEVVVVGSNVKKFVPGDKVYGCRDISSQGTLSEFISVNANELSLKPESLSYDQAASLPYAYLCANSGFNRLPAVALTSQQVLVCDIGTATGLILTQLLAHKGATVHVWCSNEFNAEFFTAGAANVFPLREKLAELDLSNFVVVFDVNAGISDFPPHRLNMNKGSNLVSWTRPGARIIEQYGPVFGTIQSVVTTNSTISSFKRSGVTLSYVTLSVESSMIEELSDKVEKHVVKPLRGKMFDISDVAEALAGFEEVDWMGPAIIRIS